MEFDSYCSKVLTEMQQGTLSGDERTWLYCGVFLNDESKNQLMVRANNWFRDGIPNDWKWYCDHVTLVFNHGSPGEEAEYNRIVENDLGRNVEIKIASVGFKNDVVAVGVELMCDRDDPTYIIRSMNKHVHITCSTAPGTKPVESNNIIRWQPIRSFNLYGKIYVCRPNPKFKK